MIQFDLITNARLHEDFWRVNCAKRQDHLAPRTNAAGAALLGKLNTRCSLALGEVESLIHHLEGGFADYILAPGDTFLAPSRKPSVIFRRRRTDEWERFGRRLLRIYR